MYDLKLNINDRPIIHFLIGSNIWGKLALMQEVIV